MKEPSVLNAARWAAMAFLASVTLAACGNSEDGEMLTDEQKLEKFSAGRKAQGQTGGAPGAGQPGPSAGP